MGSSTKKAIKPTITITSRRRKTFIANLRWTMIDTDTMGGSYKATKHSSPEGGMGWFYVIKHIFAQLMGARSDKLEDGPGLQCPPHLWPS